MERIKNRENVTILELIELVLVQCQWTHPRPITIDSTLKLQVERLCIFNRL